MCSTGDDGGHTVISATSLVLGYSPTTQTYLIDRLQYFLSVTDSRKTATRISVIEEIDGIAQEEGWLGKQRVISETAASATQVLLG